MFSFLKNPHIKWSVICIVRTALKVFYIFPVKKKRILFTSFSGKQFSCNPKYIFEYLYEKYNREMECIWCISNISILPEKYRGYIKTVRRFSVAHIKLAVTSGIIIGNYGFPAWLPKRKKQIFINTWHGGGAYKKVGNTKTEMQFSFFIEKAVRYSSDNTDFFISSCRKFSEVIHEDLYIPNNRFLNIGMPRNDIFFDRERMRVLSAMVKQKLNISVEKSLVLYAPTYRGSNTEGGFNVLFQNDFISRLVDLFAHKFGKDFIFLYRGHLLGGNVEAEDVMDVSLYPDMQELLCAVDVLITDYSSSMWDFSFAGKPGFLYVPDIDEYRAERGLHTDVETWPFSCARTESELLQKIDAWTPSLQVEKKKAHHNLFESYENGHASEKICQLIEDIVKNNMSETS